MSTVSPEAQLPQPDPVEHPDAPQGTSRFQSALRDITMGSAPVIIGAVILAVLVGSILIVATDANVQASAGYFFADPMATLRAMGDAIGGAYSALFRGAIYNYEAATFEAGIKSLMNTLNKATPLIAAGLGVGLAFRAGMFNIGGQGQILMAAAGAGWIATRVDAPWGVHLVLAILVGILFGAIWGGIAGFLKARTGAHEVIVTIMLNHIAYYLVFFALTTELLLRGIGGSNNQTGFKAETAVMPPLFGDKYAVHLGFILALIAVFVVWWLLERSSLGFRMRTVGENPAAAKTAGINVGRMYFVGMVIAGALVGIAGVSLALESEKPFGAGVDASIGFDAITVALLGGSSPFGILAAGLLFGAFKAGSATMKVQEGLPSEIVLIIQSLIVLFIAAPPLVRAIFGLPQPGKPARKERKAAKKAHAEAKAVAVSAAAAAAATASATPPAFDDKEPAFDKPRTMPVEVLDEEVSVAETDQQPAVDLGGPIADSRGDDALGASAHEGEAE